MIKKGMHEIPIVKELGRISNMSTFIKKSNIIVFSKVVNRIQKFFGFNLLIHITICKYESILSIKSFLKVENPM